MITYLSLSSLIITATIRASKWLYLKIFVGEDADLLLGCSKLVNQGDRTKSISRSHEEGKGDSREIESGIDSPKSSTKMLEEDRRSLKWRIGFI